MKHFSGEETVYKILVEFSRSDDQFHAMYHYMSIDDALDDMIHGDLQFLTRKPNVEIHISKGDFESFWGDWTDEI